MKVIFMGTPNFALKSLVALKANFDLKLVVTQPDKPVGRGKNIILTPVKDFCLNQRIDCVQPEKIKNNVELVKKINLISPDIICVAAYGKILTQELLDIPKIGCINIHASLLPKLRGAAPINKSIINGDTETGITLMKMDAGMDTGDIICSTKLRIQEDDTTASLSEKLSDLGAEEIVKLIKNLEKGSSLPLVKQEERQATFAPKMEKNDGHINWAKSSEEIHNLIRGCNPWPIAHTSLNGSAIKIYKSKLNNSEKLREGEIKKVNNLLIVGCKDKNIEIIELQKSSQKRISGKDFINGIANIENPSFI